MGSILNKKLVSIVLSVAMIFTTLTACNGVSTKSNITLPPVSTVSQNKTVSTNSTNSDIQCYFPRANQDAEQVLIDVINSSKSTLNIAIYSITDENISDAIVEAKQRNVDVKVISDKVQSSNKYQKAILSDIKNANIPIKVDTHKGIMHLKVTIADSKVVTTGSYNYTIGARDNNDEVLVVLKDKDIVKQFVNEFNNMWNDNDNFTDH